jgi:hypothetical protein
MRRDRFTFFRATFYRWAQHWDRVAAPVRAAPEVLAIGDAHVENFGTWRDDEGRLVWGTNDFDEAARLPYTNDLVRLAASAVLAHAEGQLFIASPKICDAVMLGYTSALDHGGRPIVLDGGTRWLRDLVDSNLRDADHFWENLLESPKWRGTVSHRSKALLAAGPKSAQLVRLIHRTSGAGSLGRPRLTAIYSLDGGYAAREVKARTPSAWYWARGIPRKVRDPLPRVWLDAIRSQDPFLEATKRWVVRRLAPDCSRINLAAIPKRRKESALLSVMGWELANVHLGSSRARTVQQHLRRLGNDWLPAAVDTMVAEMMRDHQLWKRHK